MFQTSFTEADADLFGANQKNFGLRWMELNSADKELMSSVIDALLDLSPNIELHNPKAIDVARGIVSFFDQLHPTTSRTLAFQKSAQAKRYSEERERPAGFAIRGHKRNSSPKTAKMTACF